jgi:hypothetical protein
MMIARRKLKYLQEKLAHLPLYPPQIHIIALKWTQTSTVRNQQ